MQKVLVLILLIAIPIGIGGYFLGTKSIKQTTNATQPNQTSADQNANWKILKSDPSVGRAYKPGVGYIDIPTAGYQLKYPTNFYYEEEKAGYQISSSKRASDNYLNGRPLTGDDLVIKILGLMALPEAGLSYFTSLPDSQAIFKKMAVSKFGQNFTYQSLTIAGAKAAKVVSNNPANGSVNYFILNRSATDDGATVIWLSAIPINSTLLNRFDEIVQTTTLLH